MVVAFLGIAGRLFYLQVIEGDAFFRITSDSIIRTEALPAVRGQIRDRKGKVLATVRPSYNVYGTPGVVKPEVFARLRALLGMNGDQAMDVWERLAAPQANPPRARAGPDRRGHLARGDGVDRDRRRSAGREDRLRRAPVVPVRHAWRRTSSAS